jgi:hypothetical protein
MMAFEDKPKPMVKEPTDAVVKITRTQFTLLHGLPADEIDVIIKYVACSETCGNSDHADLHKAILRMYIKEGSQS